MQPFVTLSEEELKLDFSALPVFTEPLQECLELVASINQTCDWLCAEAEIPLESVAPAPEVKARKKPNILSTREQMLQLKKRVKLQGQELQKLRKFLTATRRRLKKLETTKKKKKPKSIDLTVEEEEFEIEDVLSD